MAGSPGVAPRLSERRNLALPTKDHLPMARLVQNPRSTISERGKI